MTQKFRRALATIEVFRKAVLQVNNIDKGTKLYYCRAEAKEVPSQFPSPNAITCGNVTSRRNHTYKGRCRTADLSEYVVVSFFFVFLSSCLDALHISQLPVAKKTVIYLLVYVSTMAACKFETTATSIFLILWLKTFFPYYQC